MLAQGTLHDFYDESAPSAGATAARTRSARRSASRSTRLDFLQGGALHLADGSHLRTKLQAKQQQLLGRSRRRWVVAWRRGLVNGVSLVAKNKAPRGVPGRRFKSYADMGIGYRLTRDGRTLIIDSLDRGGALSALADVSTGDQVGNAYDDGIVSILDGERDRFVVLSNDYSRYVAQEWAPSSGDLAKLGKGASYANVDRDLLFIKTHGRNYGPVSLTRARAGQRTPPWTAPFQPLDISPDGLTALGLRVPKSVFHSPAILDIRRLSDGALLDSVKYDKAITEETWQAGVGHDQTARWETNEAYVFEMQNKRGSILIRCTVAGDCERASARGREISVPGETYMWW
jgi:hypothetical protein